MSFSGFITTPHWIRVDAPSRTSFTGRKVTTNNSQPLLIRRIASSRRVSAQLSTDRFSQGQNSKRQGQKKLIGIVGKKTETTKTITIDVNDIKGFFGMRANAYWERMGVLPLFFAGFGITALAIKMFKVKRGEMKDGANGVSKITLPKTAITSAEEEAELHVFKCGGCGYEMYPARGREFKFFPDSFKCPLCGKPKSEFWDLNDPDDPRNQELYEDDSESDDDDGGSDEDPSKAPSSGGVDSTIAQRDSAEHDKSA